MTVEYLEAAPPACLANHGKPPGFAGGPTKFDFCGILVNGAVRVAQLLEVIERRLLEPEVDVKSIVLSGLRAEKMPDPSLPGLFRAGE